MHYYSLNRKAPVVDFREATIKGQAPDKGLYFPELIPIIEKTLIRDIEQYAKENLAFKIMQPYVGGTIDDASLYEIVKETIDFPFPLKQITPNISTLELFHGPTLAFKDVGARFMSRCLGYFSKQQTKKITVIQAVQWPMGF
jgi:threonine synthase